MFYIILNIHLDDSWMCIPVSDFFIAHLISNNYNIYLYVYNIYCIYDPHMYIYIYIITHLISNISYLRARIPFIWVTSGWCFLQGIQATSVGIEPHPTIVLIFTNPTVMIVILNSLTSYKLTIVVINPSVKSIKSYKIDNYCSYKLTELTMGTMLFWKNGFPAASNSHRQAPATIVDPQLRNTEEGPAVTSSQWLSSDEIGDD